MNKIVSIVTPCYNEESNVEELYLKVKAEFEKLEKYDYEHIFIDNASEDKTIEKIKAIAEKDKRIKLIANSRNFGHIRSPFYGLLQATGAAVMLVVADLQDPPELIPDFIEKWEAGHEIVVGVKKESHETAVMFALRKLYYTLVNRLSDIKLKKNYTGFGLYDKKIIEILKNINDPYPYFRGLIFELGFNVEEVIYTQPKRVRGITANNFYTLYDIGMLGICSHSKVPLRVATISGFIFSVLSFLIGMAYLVVKLVFWNSLPLGMAPIVLGIFFFGSVQLFFLGIIGEYLGVMFTKINNRPLVFEKYRINF